jgi:hypothetical protein
MGQQVVVRVGPPGRNGAIVRNATQRSSRQTNRPGICPSMMRLNNVDTILLSAARSGS